MEAGEEGGQGAQFVGFVGTGDLPGSESAFADPGAQQVAAAASGGGVFGTVADFAADADLAAFELACPGGGDVDEGAGFEE